MTTLDIVKSTIKNHNLIQSGDKVIVALSGGADSSCLLHILHTLSGELNITLFAAHINHNLRAEAMNDQNAAAELCARLNIPFYVKSADVKGFAEEHKVSEEAAGREIRYAFFDELLEKLNADKLATAHNQNDFAETIVMNFIRGSGLSGLCGIPYMRGKHIIRPVMDLSRSQIEEYCFKNNLEFVTDKTNLEPIYTRNKIRLELIPYITDNFNSAFTQRIAANAEILREENEFLNITAERAYADSVKDYRGGFVIDINSFNSNHTAVKRRIVKSILSRLDRGGYGFSAKYIDAVAELALKNQTGKCINLPQDITAKTEYNTIVISRTSPDITIRDTVLTVGENILSDTDICITLSEVSHSEKCTADTVYIKCDKACHLIARSRRNGDFFYPLGMNGRKKLKDFFIDLKIPSSQRSAVPVITTDSGDIVWIAGKRADKRFIAGTDEKCIRLHMRHIK